MRTVDPKEVYRSAAKAAAKTGEAKSFETFVSHARKNVVLSEEAMEIAGYLHERPISARVLAGSLRLFEFLLIVMVGTGIWLGYVPSGEMPWHHYAIPILSGAAITVVLTQVAEGYQVASMRTVFSQVGRIYAAWSAAFAFLALVAFFLKVSDDYSRVWFAAWYMGGLTLTIACRIVLSHFVRGWTQDGRLQRRAVIVGGGKTAEELIVSLEAQPHNDVRICGIFDDRSDDRSPDIVAGYPKLGTVDQLVEFARVASIDMLIVALPLTAESRVLQMLKKLWVLPVDIRLSAHTNKLRFRPRSYTYVGAVPFLDIFDRPLADWDRIMKRCFDLFFTAVALIVFAPLMIATAAAIKLESKGPVFFRQKRYGFNNEVIDVIKFRSMFADQADPDAKNVVTKNDARVTRVGRFIRKYSIDELPQLFNVLRGELSLVGPRPHAVNAQTKDRLWDQVVDGYFARHRVMPGVTGWAQINGWRGEVDTPEKIKQRVDHDLYYIENWSVMFDLYILFMTPIRLLKTENAY